MMKLHNEKLATVRDEEIYEEAAIRLKRKIESVLGDQFVFGEVQFVFHNGRLIHIDCKPSLRAYLSENLNPGKKEGRIG